MASETWIEELRSGRVSEALDQLRQEGPSPSNFYSLGAVYMWAGDFQSALAHFQQNIQAPPPHRSAGDLSFGMAGSAAWCLGESKLAIQYWREGTKAGYAVGGANTRTALLLYVAGVLNPKTFSVSVAKGLLTDKAKHWRVERWPGPVAEYILGTRSEESTREKAAYGNEDSKYKDKSPKSWQLDFYKLLMLGASGAMPSSMLQKELRNLTNVTGSDYLGGLNFFYFLRMEEFYLARQWSRTLSRESFDSGGNEKTDSSLLSE